MRICAKNISIEVREKTVMKHFICVLLVLSVVGLSACNTVEGIGYDLKSAGEALSGSAK